MSNIALNSNLVTNTSGDLFTAFSSNGGSATASAYDQINNALQYDVLQTSSNLADNPSAYNLQAFGSAISSDIAQEEQEVQSGNLSPTDSAKVMSDLNTLMTAASSQTASMDPNFSQQVWQEVGQLGGQSGGFTFSGS